MTINKSDAKRIISAYWWAAISRWLLHCISAIAAADYSFSIATS